MMILLVIINLILIGALIFILARKRTQGGAFQDLEDVELIEFQQNIKQLIDEIKLAAENGVSSIDVKKSEMEKVLHESEKAVKELKYLIDRNKIIRTAEYKTEISTSRLNRENNVQALPPETIVAVKQPAEAAETPEKHTAAKFLLNDDIVGGTVPHEQGRYERVNNLIKNGMSIEEISTVTGMSRGEIELIRNLKKK
jgi:hypothetical protein